jgi:choline dehydrogenase-like flavoprotein
MFEVIIVGSGAAGVAAAFSLAAHGIKPLILDVGFSNQPLNGRVSQNLYDFKAEQDSFELTIGKDYRGLDNIAKPDNIVPVKLTAPNFGFVTQGSEQLSPYHSKGFNPVQSFARGLANAWGAGVYRFLKVIWKDFLLEADLADILID